MVKIRLSDIARILDVRPTTIVEAVGPENVKLMGWAQSKKLYVCGFTIEQIKGILNK